LFQALEEPDQFRHYLNVQATQEKALDVNRSIRAELEMNEIIRAMYGEQMGERWTDQRFVTSKGVIFSAIGAGQSVRGINYRNVRPDYLIVDDLYDEEDIHNPDATKKKNNWFWSSLYPARAKSRRTSIHVQGTAINPYDLLEELKTRPSVKSATFQAIEDEAAGKILWPELHTLESLKQDRILMGPIIFAREQQNERLDETTTILRRADWKYYKELPSGFDIVVTSWDMSFSETVSGSYVVGQVWGKRGPDFYLFPTMIRARMDFVNTLASFRNLALAFQKIDGHLIEAKANGPAVMSALGKEVSGIIPILPHGSKKARAVAITPLLSGGNILLPDPAICPADPETGLPWVVGFVEEAARFRGADGEVNDQVDTATQAINYLRQTRYFDAGEIEQGDFIETEDDIAGGFSE